MIPFRKIPYGISDFARIRRENYYYIDKTRFIPVLEASKDFAFFVRPRRFGKSLFLSTLENYYDIARKDDFQRLFGGLDIARNPTPYANSYLILKLDFSKVAASGSETLESAFERHLSACMDRFAVRYASIFGTGFATALAEQHPASKLETIVTQAGIRDLPLYLVIDEYDNFTNAMIRAGGVGDYRAITHGAGFYRAWFKKFKGSFDRIFMTGVSPVTLDDLTSGFNIAENVSQDPRFNAMLGFSQAECERMYADYLGAGEFTSGNPAALVRSIKPWYDGYCFAEEKIGKESVFNSDMVLYHLKHMVELGEPPKNMIDVNVRTDYEKLRTIADIQRHLAAGSEQDALPVTEQVLTTPGIAFDLVPSFPAEQITRPANFKSLFHYYGLLSMAGRAEGAVVFGIPNECVRHQMFGYLREVYFPLTKDWSDWEEAARAFAYRGNWQPLLEIMASNYKASGAVRDGIRGETRLQGYFQAEFGHLTQFLVHPELELALGYADFALFPERVHFGDVPHSYLVELKYAPADATDADLAALRDAGTEQLRRYAADPAVPALARGTTLHSLLVLYRFHDMLSATETATAAF